MTSRLSTLYLLGRTVPGVIPVVVFILA
ncbi:MAG: hypothetical protein QOG30_557, partial [Acidimicrobiaceae bacterium]